MTLIEQPHLSGGKPTKSGLLADKLRTDILCGTLQPGARLNLDRLREQLGVSVTSVREAVTRLVSDGFVEAEEQKGYRVAPVSLDNLVEITTLRVELEPFALRAAIQKGDLEWETGVMAALYRLNHTDRPAGDGTAIEAWEIAHNQFHFALMRGCEMPLLLQFINKLHNMNNRYRRLFLSERPGQRNVVEEHSAIAEAAVARHVDEAAGMLAAHLERTGTTLHKLLAERLPGQDQC